MDDAKTGGPRHDGAAQRHFALIGRDGAPVFVSGSAGALAGWLQPGRGGAMCHAETGRPVHDDESPHAAVRAGRSLGPTRLRRTLARGVEEAVLTVTPVAGAPLAVVVVEPTTNNFSPQDFMAVATHELKSPIASLHLDLERLRRKFRDLEQVSGAEVAREMERASRQVTRLTHLMQNFIDVSQMQNGMFALRVDAHDLCAIVAEVVDGLQPLATRAGCTLRVSCCDAVHGAWDRLRIEQVVHNLTMNALKYASQGGAIEVEVARAGATAVQLRVRDHGPGVPAEEREAIFQPFVRASSSHLKQSLGLGLYVVREIVAAHGGRAWVEPTEGGGATFVAELPQAAA